MRWRPSESLTGSAAATDYHSHRSARLSTGRSERSSTVPHRAAAGGGRTSTRDPEVSDAAHAAPGSRKGLQMGARPDGATSGQDQAVGREIPVPRAFGRRGGLLHVLDLKRREPGLLRRFEITAAGPLISKTPAGRFLKSICSGSIIDSRGAVMARRRQVIALSVPHGCHRQVGMRISSSCAFCAGAMRDGDDRRRNSTRNMVGRCLTTIACISKKLSSFDITTLRPSGIYRWPLSIGGGPYAPVRK